MKLTDTGVVDSIIAPVTGHSQPEGEDVRYDIDFERIESEISKITSIHKDQKTDWKLVQTLGYDLLVNRSKDLRILCWFSFSILKNQNNEQLPAIFDLIQLFIKKYWNSCFPQKHRARLAVLNWLFERIDYNENGYAEDLSTDSLSSLIASFESCIDILEEKFGDDAPFLQPKLQQLRDIRHRQKQVTETATVIKPVVVSSSSTISPAVPTTTAITEEGDGVRIARYLQEQSRVLISWFLTKDIADPRAYLLTRSCAWLQIVSAPIADAQGITKLKPLSTNKLQEYQQRLAAKEYSSLIPELEISLSKAPFWLDGHHWCAQALDGLGHSEMAIHLRDYLRSFLNKFSSLIDLYFDDGSPFASESTKEWLSSSSAGSDANHFSLTHNISENQPWLAALASAQENAKRDSSCLKQEMRALQILANAAESGRDKAMWQLSLAKFCQQSQRHDLAVLILEELYQSIELYRLQHWEPLLVKEVLLLWQTSLEKTNAKQHQNKINEIKTNLYRMDISIAF